ncbi:MAG: hypothetical protein K0S57_2632 [Ramlibacter sp.]|nr:hypothetical protein [Ramlibacter sp.]
MELRANRRVANLPDFLHHGVLPFVSERMKGVLIEAGGFKGEFHPIRLFSAEHENAKPYWYFRLLTRLDALDRDASEIEYFPGSDSPRKVWQLRLGPVPSELNVFRLRKLESIFVSAKLAEAICTLKVRLTPAENFRLGW